MVERCRPSWRPISAVECPCQSSAASLYLSSEVICGLLTVSILFLSEKHSYEYPRSPRYRGEFEIVLQLVYEPAVPSSLLGWTQKGVSTSLVMESVNARPIIIQITSVSCSPSTIDAVVAAASLRTRINKIAVARYLAYAYLPGGPTLLEGVSEVLPGQHLRWADGRLTATQFWDTLSEPESPSNNETALRETLRLYLDRAIERRLGGPTPNRGVIVGRCRFQSRRCASWPATWLGLTDLLGIIWRRLPKRTRMEFAGIQTL